MLGHASIVLTPDTSLTVVSSAAPREAIAPARA
jgi:hypothetical protein